MISFYCAGQETILPRRVAHLTLLEHFMAMNGVVKVEKIPNEAKAVERLVSMV